MLDPEEPVLSQAVPGYSWPNLLQSGYVLTELGSSMEAVFQQLFGVAAFRLLLLVLICATPLFLVLHLALLRWSFAYQKLEVADRFIVVQHSVYAVVFAASVVPQTMLALEALFKGWTGAYLSSPSLTMLCALFLSMRALLYLIEACVRAVVKRSWLLLLHHELFYLLLVLAVYTENAAIVAIGITLDLFAAHEAPLYAGLVAHRLRWGALITRAILRAACVWYVLTRIFQTVVLIYMIQGFAQMPAVKWRAEFIVVVIICVVLTAVQGYTLVIYKHIDAKLTARLRDEKGSTSVECV